VDGLRWGVEPICRVLSEHGVPIAPSTYYDAIKARRQVTPAELREEQLMLAIARVHHENYSVYGARKVWLTLNREGIPVARCTVERLMKVLGLRGARRGRTVRTTQSDPAAVRPADLVERNFNPSRPDALWVADFSYVPTWAGFVYVAFVIDPSADGSWAGAPPAACAPSWSSTRWRWRSGPAPAAAWRTLPGWCTTPTPDPSTPRSGSPSGW
jgi:putative transposase